MRFQLLGGPVEHEIPVPWPEGAPLPPFVCSGDEEPFQHYVGLDASWPIFVYVGPCRLIDHAGSYPHSHPEDR